MAAVLDFLKSLPWELILAAALGGLVGFWLGRFFAEDSGEGARYDYLSGKKRLRE